MSEWVWAPLVAGHGAVVRRANDTLVTRPGFPHPPIGRAGANRGSGPVYGYAVTRAAACTRAAGKCALKVLPWPGALLISSVA